MYETINKRWIKYGPWLESLILSPILCCSMMRRNINRIREGGEWRNVNCELWIVNSEISEFWEFWIWKCHDKRCTCSSVRVSMASRKSFSEKFAVSLRRFRRFHHFNYLQFNLIQFNSLLRSIQLQMHFCRFICTVVK